MDTIRVFDDFLAPHEFQFVYEFFKYYARWIYGHTDSPECSVYWFKCLLSKERFFTEYLLSKINKLTNHNWTLDKCYANGQTIMLDGRWHGDFEDEEDNDTHRTAILYTSDITPENIDTVKGAIEFRNNDEIKCIEPFRNRLVFFNSHIQHRGRAPCVPGIFRISVVLKLKK